MISSKSLDRAQSALAAVREMDLQAARMAHRRGNRAANTASHPRR